MRLKVVNEKIPNFLYNREEVHRGCKPLDLKIFCSNYMLVLLENFKIYKSRKC